jgi:3-dehydroquinate synthase
MSPKELGATAFRALRAKKWFIEIEEFDQKERLLLNFGHTFGHAIEAGTNFAVSHGIGVGIGMLVAVELARQQDALSPAGVERTARLVQHVRDLLGAGGKCVIKAPDCTDLDLVLEKFENDKKHLSGVYRMICPQRDGELEVVSLPKTDATRRLILASYQAVLGGLGWHTKTAHG